ncbi:MAG TPA: hypothetical protein VGH70_07040 [Bradyrhizobium sp.]
MSRFEKPATLALFGCWLFGFGFIAWQSTISQPNQNPKTASEHRADTRSPKSSTDERLADYTWWLAVLTGGLVVTAIGQGFFIARSDKTARIAANAATKSAEVAEKTLRLTQRAYLVIDRINSTAGHDDQGKLMGYLISITWKNTGASPALNFGSIILPTIVDRSMNPKDVIVNTDRSPSTVNGVAGQNVPVHSRRIQIPIQDIIGTYDGKRAIIIWARATYVDVFDATDQHIVEAAFEMQVIGNPLTNVPGAEIFSFSMIGDYSKSS